MNSPAPASHGRPRLAVVHGEAAILDGQWASDHWDAGRLGIPARRGRGTARFGGISQPWLRDPVKRWSRFRLATGCAFATVDAGALALTRFSRFLATRHPEAAGASAITRPVLENYMSWLLTQGYSASARALSLSMIRVFFEACHRHGWLPGLAASATIYVEELPFHHDEIARFIPCALARIAKAWADNGWPAEPDDSGPGITAPFNAPSQGPPPWNVYRIEPRSAIVTLTVEPGGLTRFRF